MNLFQRLTEMAERMSPRKLLAVCAAIALIVFAIIYMLLSSLLESPAGEKQASVTAVVEAAQDIPANTVITEDMVKTVNINPEAMPKGAFTDMRAAVGKTVSVPMQEGDVLTARKVSARGPAGFLGLIPPGMRAISFSVNDVTAVAGFAKPGDKVDILLTSDKVNEDNITTKMLLRDVLLLAVNKTAMNSPAAQADAAGTPAVVTVALTPYDAAKLLASAQLGQLQLMLRPFGDVCHYLKLQPERTVADAQRAALRNPESLRVTEYLTPYDRENVRFDVLANPLLLEEAYNMDIQVIRRLISELQIEYDYVVIDTTSTFSALNLSIMDLSTVIYYMGIIDFIPTIKDMKIGADLLKDLGYSSKKIQFILNRNNARTRIAKDDVVRILGREFNFFLPNDFRSAQQSIQQGVPLIIEHGETELAQQIGSIVSAYVPERPSGSHSGRSEGGWIGRLFS